MTKQCSRCKKELDISFFTKDNSTTDKLFRWCKVCVAETNKQRYLLNRSKLLSVAREYARKRKLEDPEKLREIARRASKKFRLLYPEKARATQKKHRESNYNLVRKQERESEERRKAKSPIEFIQKRKERTRRRYQLKYKYDLKYRLNNSMRSGIGASLSGRKNRKNWYILTGYSREELEARLQFLFKIGISWKTYGKGPGKWSIDHIKPIDAFNFSSYDDLEFKECWALDNLRPLWNELNNRKRHLYVPTLLSNGLYDDEEKFIKEHIEQHSDGTYKIIGFDND